MSGTTNFEDPSGKATTKQITDRIAPVNNDQSAPAASDAARPPTPQVSVRDGPPAADVTSVSVGGHEGENDGSDNPGSTSLGESSGKALVTDNGTKIGIVSQGASESIVVVHPKGGQIRIGADGAVTIQSSSSKGFSLNAEKGGGTISVRGKLVIDADDIIFQSKGNMQFHAKNFLQYGINHQTQLSGSMTQEIDGSFDQEIGNYLSSMVAGEITLTSGKKISQQASEAITMDTDAIGMRATHSATLEAGSNIKIAANNDATFSAKGIGNVMADKGLVMSSSEGALYIAGKELASIDSLKQISMKSPEIVIQSKPGSVVIDATTAVNVSTKDINFSATDNLKTYSKNTKMSGTSGFNVDVSGPIDIRGTPIDLNKGDPSPDSTLTIKNHNGFSPIGAVDAAEAVYPDTQSVVDSITSRRMAPEYENNAYDVSQNQIAVEQNNGASVPQQAVQSASQNSPGSERPEASGPEIRIPSSGRKNNVAGEPSPYPPPGTTEAPEQLSKNVLAFPGIEKIPGKGFAGYEKSDIIDNIQILCHNVIDKVIDKFGSQVSFGINGGFRLNESDTGHNSGNAVDIHATNKMDTAKTLEIANWIKDNCYFDELRIELDAEGSIHIHVQIDLDPDVSATAAGEQRIKSCKDYKCESYEDDVLTAKYSTIKLNERDN